MSISKIDRPFSQFIKVWCYDVRMIIERGNVIIEIINGDEQDVRFFGFSRLNMRNRETCNEGNT